TLGSTISVTACYWKNSEKVDLGTEQGIAESIFVDKNNDVYVAGIYGALGGSDMRAAYWKNGVLTILSDEQSYGFSIYVYNGKVYVAGSSATSALYWVDGVKHELSTNNAIAMGLFVYNGDVYVSGTTGNMANPVYWVNDKEVALTDGSVPSIVTSIYVRNGVVYTAGLYGIETSSVVYWKNAIDASSKAEMISLPVGSYTAKLDMSLLMFGAIPKIFVDEDNNVYATSSLLDPARSTYIGAYWYNGSLTPNEEAIYSSVFVE
ncbi:MAG: hypothetical protein WCQ53_05610, partial [bacterium]